MPSLRCTRWSQWHHALCLRRMMDMSLGSRLARGTCSFLALKNGHAQWARGCTEGRAPGFLDRPEGHAHSSLRPVDTMASCPLPAPSEGHAQWARAARTEGHVRWYRAAQRNMPALNAGSGACPAAVGGLPSAEVLEIHVLAVVLVVRAELVPVPVQHQTSRRGQGDSGNQENDPANAGRGVALTDGLRLVGGV